MPEQSLKGSLPQPSLYQVFQALDAGRKTGVLRLERDQSIKALYFESGRIRFATTTRADERLGAEAVRQRLATWWEVQEAAQEISAGKRLGTIMVDRGILSGDEQSRLVRDQLRHIVVDALGWRDGTFDFEEGPQPPKERILLDWPVTDAILEEARRTTNERGLLEALGGLPGLLTRKPGAAALPLDLNSNESRILSAVDGTRTVPEIARMTRTPEEVTIRTLAGLVRAGCLVAPILTRAQRAAIPRRLSRKKKRRASPTPPAAQTLAAGQTSGGFALSALDRSRSSRAEEGHRVLPRGVRQERAALRKLADQLHQLDHYQVLGVQPQDSRERIREAFHELAVKFHPDRGTRPGMADLGDDLERVYHRLRIAYQTIENPESRKEYDSRRGRDHRAAEEIHRAALASTAAYLHTANRLIQRGLLLDAIPVLQEAIRTGPQCGLAHYRLGQCLAATAADSAPALYHFERALQIDPESARYQAAIASMSPKEEDSQSTLAHRVARWLHRHPRTD